jgi:hypothetical protein
VNYSLENFCMDAKASLLSSPGSSGRKAVRAHLEKLLLNEAFIAEFLETKNRGKKVLYHDPETDFYVNAHGTDEGKRKGKPHDHGQSWAVYGQATGLTNMTVWDRTDDGSDPDLAQISERETFPLIPGKAALFDTGIIHSTAHPTAARWVRVTGTNLDLIERYTYDPERHRKILMRPSL